MTCALRQRFEWQILGRFNMGVASSDVRRPDQAALIVESRGGLIRRLSFCVKDEIGREVPAAYVVVRDGTGVRRCW
jgi:hypothetical protein